MTIKVVKDDVTIEVDNEHELKIVLNALRHNLPKDRNLQQPNLPLADFDPYARVFQDISPLSKSYKLLLLLKGQPSGMSDSELWEKLGIENGQALGGVLGAITKLATKYGLSGDDVWQSGAGADGRSWYYRLTDRMQKAMEQPEEKT